MRQAASIAVSMHEPFITPRAILLALLDDPQIGPAVASVVEKEKVLAADVEYNFGAVRVLQEILPGGEQPSMTRYDTLAFKTPDGRTSMWLSREAWQIFLEGSKRAAGRYSSRDLALGVAAEAITSPGLLAAMRLEPGILMDAIP